MNTFLAPLQVATHTNRTDICLSQNPTTIQITQQWNTIHWIEDVSHQLEVIRKRGKSYRWKKEFTGGFAGQFVYFLVMLFEAYACEKDSRGIQRNICNFNYKVTEHNKSHNPRWAPILQTFVDEVLLTFHSLKSDTMIKIFMEILRISYWL